MAPETIPTRLTQLLGIRYPIVQGGLQWLARPELAAAVSNAGGLGIITAMSVANPAALRVDIRRLRDLTDQPFGVNVSMLPEFAGGEDGYRPFFEVCAEERVPVVETAGRNPQRFVELLHGAGVKLIHKVPAVRFARKAQRIGADAVTVVGFECGGHPGMDDVGTLVLVRRAVEGLDVPVIAAGGFADGRAVAAALALGADGVLMGTRFVATKECPIHERFKQALVAADETSTMLILRSIRNAARVLRNAAAKKVAEAEGRGAGLGEILSLVAGNLGREAYLEGDLEKATVACGQGVGLVHDVPTVAELMSRLAGEIAETCARLGALAGPGAVAAPEPA